MIMTEAQLSEGEKAEREATPKPWTWDSYNTLSDKENRIMCRIPDHPEGDGDTFTSEQSAERGAWYKESASNAVLIEWARANLADLLADCRKMREALERASHADGCASFCSHYLDKDETGDWKNCACNCFKAVLNED